MDRSKKLKQKPLLESFFFSSPEQKLFRFLLSEATTVFSPRVLSSRLKGIRGLGGSEGIMRILQQLHELGLIQFHNNNREISICNDHLVVHMLKTFAAICDLDGLVGMVQPISAKGILYGSRATGKARTDSNYNLFVLSDSPEEVRKVVTRHPLGRRIELLVCEPNEFTSLERKNPDLIAAVDQGIVMWGSSW